MKRDKNFDEKIVEKLDEIADLLQQLLALEYYRDGASKEVIGKHLHIAKAKVVSLLKGIERENRRK